MLGAQRAEIGDAAVLGSHPTWRKTATCACVPDEAGRKAVALIVGMMLLAHADGQAVGGRTRAAAMAIRRAGVGGAGRAASSASRRLV